MKTISLFNNKGGVGKTTSVINLAYILAESGKQVLVIDCDGQQNCSRFFASEQTSCGVEKTLLTGCSPESCYSPTRYSNIDVLVSTKQINNIQNNFSELEKQKRSENVSALFCNHSKNYDYILLDLPPAMSVLNEELLASSDCVVVPIELGTFSIQGIANVTETLNRVGAKFAGCFVTKFDKKNPADYQLLDILKNSLGNKTFQSLIPFSRVIKNSISYKLTAMEYMPWADAVGEYKKLVEEIIERM